MLAKDQCSVKVKVLWLQNMAESGSNSTMICFLMHTTWYKYPYVICLLLLCSVLPPENDAPLPKDASHSNGQTHIAEHYPVHFCKMSTYMDMFLFSFSAPYAPACWHPTIMIKIEQHIVLLWHLNCPILALSRQKTSRDRKTLPPMAYHHNPSGASMHLRSHTAGFTTCNFLSVESKDWTICYNIKGIIRNSHLPRLPP